MKLSTARLHAVVMFITGTGNPVWTWGHGDEDERVRHSTRIICAAEGVRSGTGIVDELLLQKIHRIVKELHHLCISQEGAAKVVSRMASKLDHGDFQQLQVLILTNACDFVTFLCPSKFHLVGLTSGHAGRSRSRGAH